MLILSRQSGQSIRIGDNIVVTVSRIFGNKGRLGIHAPIDIRIVREDAGDKAGMASRARRALLEDRVKGLEKQVAAANGEGEISISTDFAQEIIKVMRAI